MVINKYLKKLINRNLFLLILVVISCENPYFANLHGNDEMTINVKIDPRLPQDDNGYFHLTLNRSKWQTIHRFSGLVTDSNDNPLDVVRFEWTSNLYWVLGDTLGYIIKRGLTDEMVYVNYDTIPITGFEGHIVPTINSVSYSNSKGEFNQMSGFVRNMVGDTAEIEISYGTREVSNESERIKFAVVLD